MFSWFDYYKQECLKKRNRFVKHNVTYERKESNVPKMDCSVFSYVIFWHTYRCECVYVCCIANQFENSSIGSVWCAATKNARKLVCIGFDKTFNIADFIMSAKRVVRCSKFAPRVSCGCFDRSKQDSIDILSSNDSKKTQEIVFQNDCQFWDA